MVASGFSRTIAHRFRLKAEATRVTSHELDGSGVGSCQKRHFNPTDGRTIQRDATVSIRTPGTRRK